MKIDYNHNLTQDEAYTRINNLLGELKKKHSEEISNPQMSWNSQHTIMDYSVKIKGFSSSGQITLKEGQVSLEGKLPFAAKIFSGKIERMVREKLDDLFS